MPCLFAGRGELPLAGFGSGIQQTTRLSGTCALLAKPIRLDAGQVRQ